MWFNGIQKSSTIASFFALFPFSPRHITTNSHMNAIANGWAREQNLFCLHFLLFVCASCFWNYLIIFSALWKNWLLASAQRTCSSPGGWIANVFHVMFVYRQRQPMLLCCTHVSICIFSEKNKCVCEATHNTYTLMCVYAFRGIK